jgi:hypothetical protein
MEHVENQRRELAESLHRRQPPRQPLSLRQVVVANSTTLAGTVGAQAITQLDAGASTVFVTTDVVVNVTGSVPYADPTMELPGDANPPCEVFTMPPLEAIDMPVSTISTLLRVTITYG